MFLGLINYGEKFQTIKLVSAPELVCLDLPTNVNVLVEKRKVKALFFRSSKQQEQTDGKQDYAYDPKKYAERSKRAGTCSCEIEQYSADYYYDYAEEFLGKRYPERVAFFTHCCFRHVSQF
jgi:hypothetical protein